METRSPHAPGCIRGRRIEELNTISAPGRRCPRPPVPGGLRRLFAGGLLAAAMTAAHAQGSWTVVASGLNNPRGLDFAPNGALYIAEAGTGGSGPSVERGNETLFLGMTGSVTRVFRGVQERIVTGLPSLAGSDGSGAAGPSAIDFGQLGHGYLTIGLGLDPALRAILGTQGADLGTLMQINQNGQLQRVADLAAFEAAYNPDGHHPDTNPNGVASSRGGAVYVADAGANTLLHVDARGKVSLVAVFEDRTAPVPPIPMQAVPTNVVVGPDGALYVSELTGFPFPLGEARIYRVVPGSPPAIFRTGFTNIIDLEFDAQGNLYVLEIHTQGLASGQPPMGRLARINADGSVQTIASAGLVMPGGMAIGPDGAIYVSNFSVVPGGGVVVRIQP